jgi:hypothetical protein
MTKRGLPTNRRYECLGGCRFLIGNYIQSQVLTLSESIESDSKQAS